MIVWYSVRLSRARERETGTVWYSMIQLFPIRLHPRQHESDCYIQAQAELEHISLAASFQNCSMVLPSPVWVVTSVWNVLLFFPWLFQKRACQLKHAPQCDMRMNIPENPPIDASHEADLRPAGSLALGTSWHQISAPVGQGISEPRAPCFSAPPTPGGPMRSASVTGHGMARMAQEAVNRRK